MEKRWSDFTNADFEFIGKMILLRSALNEASDIYRKRFDCLIESLCKINLVKSSTGKLETLFEFDSVTPILITGILCDFGLISVSNSGKPIISKSKYKNIAKIIYDMFNIKK